MTNMQFRKIGIVGSGRMGESIFYHLNDFDYSLVWIFRKEDLRDKAIAKFNKKLRRMHKTGILSDNAYHTKKDDTLITVDMEDLRSCDLIIETIIEDAEMKSALFRKLDSIVNKDCVFTSNSSSIKPSLICPDSDRRDKFAGIHFFYPVPFNTIVELTGADGCSSETIESLKVFTRDIGKQVLTLPEQGAFILNKAFIYTQAQAFRFRQEQILSFREIDALIKEHIFAMGVFEFLDQVGLDVIVSAAKHYFEDMEHKDFIHVTIEETQKLVDKGYLGVKSGKGFYSYNKEEPGDEPQNLKPVSEVERKKYKEEVVNKLICIYINSAYDFVDKGYCTEDEIETALDGYNGMEKGPVALGRQVGFRKVYDLSMDFYKQTGEKVFYPSPSLKSRADMGKE